MRNPDLIASFEYYGIVIPTFDVEILRHLDYKNDNHKNYNHTFVYSFAQDGYKVSIIMTT